MMKKIFAFINLAVLILLLSTTVSAQDPPGVIWSDFFPGNHDIGNYTANDIKQSPYGGYALTGRRSMTSPYGGYGEVVFMLVDEDGAEIPINQIFTGFRGSVPWDQEAYDMLITTGKKNSYLLTGYRDKSLISDATPPGLFLMEVSGDGSVLFDSLYFNEDEHHIAGRCIHPAINGGYIIASSFMENGEGAEQTMLTRLEKNSEGEFVHTTQPAYAIIAAGQGGYAKWIAQYEDGYLLAGTAFQDMSKKYDLFIQKVDINYDVLWTRFFGWADSDEFADALIAGDHLYIAGSAGVPVPGTNYFKDQIYVAKLNANEEIVWERTYGNNHAHYANKIMMTGEGDLVIAGTAYDEVRHTHMILMKIDAETGDSLWTQFYGSQFETAGIRDAIRTDDFGYLLAGRGSYPGSQDPRIYLMKLDPGDEKEHLSVSREGLSIPITTTEPAIDVINFTTSIDSIYGLTIVLDSLLHPSVGDLQVKITHNGITRMLADRPVNSGENFINTGFSDQSFYLLDRDTAHYAGWYRPEESLSLYRTHQPGGDWILTIIDFGSSQRKAASRMLKGWTINMLTDSVSGTGFLAHEVFENFGLEAIHPNPVDESTLIRFSINQPGKVRVSVYNMLGQLAGVVMEEFLTEGVHERQWSRGSLPGGAYFVHLECKGMISVRKVVLQ